MNIAEFKLQNPAYQGVDDAVLAQKLYQKFYSDKMPESDFMHKAGITQLFDPETTRQAAAKVLSPDYVPEQAGTHLETASVITKQKAPLLMKLLAFDGKGKWPTPANIKEDWAKAEEKAQAIIKANAFRENPAKARLQYPNDPAIKYFTDDPKSSFIPSLWNTSLDDNRMSEVEHLATMTREQRKNLNTAKGKIGIGEHFGDKKDNREFMLFTVLPTLKSLEFKSALDRLQSDQYAEGSPDKIKDQMIIRDKLFLIEEMQDRGMSLPAEITDAMANMVKYAGEIGLMGGLTGGAAGETVMGRVGKGMQQAIMNAPEMMNLVTQRMTDKGVIGDKGEFLKTENGQALAKALPKSFLDQTVTYWTEQQGEVIGKALGKLGSRILSKLPAGIASGLMKAGKLTEPFYAWAKKGGLDGMIPEMIEEYVQRVITPILMLDDQNRNQDENYLDRVGKSFIPDPRELLVQTVLFGLLPIAGTLAGKAGLKAPSRKEYEAETGIKQSSLAEREAYAAKQKSDYEEALARARGRGDNLPAENAGQAVVNQETPTTAVIPPQETTSAVEPTVEAPVVEVVPEPKITGKSAVQLREEAKEKAQIGSLLDANVEDMDFDQLKSYIRKTKNAQGKFPDLADKLEVKKQQAIAQQPVQVDISNKVAKEEDLVATHQIYKEADKGMDFSRTVEIDPKHPYLIHPDDWSEIEDAIAGNPVLEKAFKKSKSDKDKTKSIDEWKAENFITGNDYAHQEGMAVGEGANKIRGYENVPAVSLFVEAIKAAEQRRVGQKKRFNQFTPEQGEAKPKRKQIISKESRDKAAKRIKGKGLRSGLDPQDFADLLIIGGYHFETGIRDFAEWSTKMVADIGERVRKHLDNIWTEIHNPGTYEKNWNEQQQAKSKGVANEVQQKVQAEKVVKKKVEAAKPKETAKPDTSTGERVKSESTIVDRLAETLKDNDMEAGREYNENSNEKTAQAVHDFVTKHTTTATAIVMYDAENTSGLDPYHLAIGLALQAEANKQYDLMAQYQARVVELGAKAGQMISAVQALIPETSSLYWSKILTMANILKNFKEEKTATGETVSPAQVARKKVKAKVESATDAINKGQMKVNRLLERLEQMRCK